MRHVTHINEPSDTYEWGTSHVWMCPVTRMNESYHMHECAKYLIEWFACWVCVAVCCSVLQCVAVCCSILQYVAVRCCVSQCLAVSCSVLQCLAVYCTLLQCVAACFIVSTARSWEDETRNSHRNAKQNSNRNQETIVLGLFSHFQIERDLEQ